MLSYIDSSADSCNEIRLNRCSSVYSKLRKFATELEQTKSSMYNTFLLIVK